jgi:hypothetical protein
VVNSRAFENINKFYNTVNAELQSKLKQRKGTSLRIQVLSNKCNLKVDDIRTLAVVGFVEERKSLRLALSAKQFPRHWPRE